MPCTDTHPQTGADERSQPQVDTGDWAAADDLPNDPDAIRAELVRLDVWEAEHAGSPGCAEDGAVYRRRLALNRQLPAPARRHGPRGLEGRRAS
ncbi:hypothetical protein [Streptomyces luteolus]|uniref:Uncharacterized protein n=1 Tax=Streptomyces luteolus TaxID=3043615 RepID=A0ABT6T1D8_9ACTN|nr:hypothetical protein [Streptomyces sp. B-S-A12]MDI3420717.1 hypothetical protein [Streptomyces sp. B-S-A12]